VRTKTGKESLAGAARRPPDPPALPPGIAPARAVAELALVLDELLATMLDVARGEPGELPLTDRWTTARGHLAELLAGLGEVR
jgi:hypothetical protein